jgi:sugar phosphate isomerase/epimerase
MNKPLTDYARIGATHNSIYPFKHDPDRHLESLAILLSRADIQVVDLTLPYGKAHRESAIQLARAAGKYYVYNGYMLPTAQIPLCTRSATERAQILMLARDQVDMAFSIGARYFMQSVGADPGAEHREAAFAALEDYITQLDQYIRFRGSMPFLIELMDRHNDKKSLCGPTAEVISFVGRLAESIPDIGLVIDINHLLLMEEPMEEAFRRCLPFLKHVHLGNCMRWKGHRLWGGKHPPIGIEGGMVDIPELTALFRLLLKIGYLNKELPGTLSLEIIAFPGKSEEESITDNLERVHRAWAAV